jgi:hypothetical protein
VKIFLPVFLILVLLAVNSTPSHGEIPRLLVRFEVENEAGRDVAQKCAEVWNKEGPRILADLVPVGTSLDTITCLILNTDSFQRNFAGRLPDWGVGVALSGGRFIAVDYSRLSAVGRGVREVFLHEMVHALLFQVAGETWLPTWFHEGCAMLYSGEWKFSDTVSLVLDGKVPSLDNLQMRFPRPHGLADRAYRTSLLAVTRLRDQFGDQVVGELLAASSRTGAFALAFPEVTGVSLGDYTADFDSTMNFRLGWVVMWTRWPSLFVLMALIFAAGALRKIFQTRRRLAEMVDEEEDPIA